MTDCKIKYREFTQQRLEEFISKGYKQKYFFPHKVFHLPKCAPDGLKMAIRMCGVNDPNQLWEIILYAQGPVLNEFPDDLFFDDDLVWHQQHLGKKGQIATVGIVVKGNQLYTMNHLSDIVQRISRRREYKTRIENRFKGWHHLLLNSILNFAVENKLDTVFTPTADFVIATADPKRKVQRELFDRIYDRAVHRHFSAIKTGHWWCIDVKMHLHKLIVPEKGCKSIKHEKTICLAHDIERGLGHTDVDPKFAEFSNQSASQHLKEMLAIEKEKKFTATYFVVGCLMDEIRDQIEKDSHCLAFHSYDHGMERDQLHRCRDVDYRLKGYNPPRSKISSELSDKNLCFHNFEWLASSWHSFDQATMPYLQNRIVKIPILFDDWEIYSKKISYEEWQQQAIQKIEENDFVAFYLHDCYGAYWLPHYHEFLTKIEQLGEFKTLDAVSAETIFKNSQ